MADMTAAIGTPNRLKPGLADSSLLTKIWRALTEPVDAAESVDGHTYVGQPYRQYAFAHTYAETTDGNRNTIMTMNLEALHALREACDSIIANHELKPRLNEACINTLDGDGESSALYIKLIPLEDDFKRLPVPLAGKPGNLAPEDIVG
jgi:hypothetical protein